MKERTFLLLIIAAGSIGIIASFVLRPAPGTNTAAQKASAQGIDSQRIPAISRRSEGTRQRPTNATSITSLPATSTPLAESFAVLKILADQGDAVAASRLYQQLNTCNRQQAVERVLSDSIAQMQIAADATDLPAEDRLRLGTSIEKKRRFLVELKSRCAGVDASELSDLPSITLRAAQLGDADARTCYVQRGPMTNPQAAIASPELFSEYRDNVAQLIDAGIAQGDWRIIDMLRYAYAPGGNSLLSGYTGFDPAMQYRYTKLFRLAATNEYRISQLDADLARLTNKISSAQISDADAWAQQARAGDFSTSSTDAIAPNWDACERAIYL